MKIDFSEVKAKRLAKYHNLGDFDCKDADINDFIKNEAFMYQEKSLATTTLFIYNEDIIGFFSAADSIKLKSDEKEGHNLKQKNFTEFPAIKIARLGRDCKYRDANLGAKILEWAIGYILRCSELVAVRFVTVDSYPKRLTWYEGFGFVRNLDKKYKKKDNHVSLRYDLFNKDQKVNF